MNHKIEYKINANILKESSSAKEKLLRQVAAEAIRQLPIEEVVNLFNLSLIYGNAEELKEAHMNNDYSRIEFIEFLMKENKSCVKGSIYINK